MARVEFSMWGFCFMFMLAQYQVQEAQGAESVPGLGINWGALASHPLNLNIVVNMLKDNGIKKVKLFDADPWTVSALSGTDIEVMVGIPNDQLSKFAGSSHNAEHWVKANITKRLHGHHGAVKIRPHSQQCKILAIDKAGLGDTVKVTTALNADVYESSSGKPSDGNFRSDIGDDIKQILSFLHERNSPFLVNIYPFLSLYQDDNFPEEFAFLDGQGRIVQDKNVQYSNVYDANLDTLVWSLRKAGYPDMRIVVGEIGWPTDGDKNANNKNAKRFYEGLLKKMGQDKWPIAAKGVVYQERKWCVLNSDVKNLSLVPSALDYACAGADCTSLGFGCSCENLDLATNASYAFNQYFQSKGPKVEAKLVISMD
ncbi:unnamed protein product [Sphenostylis stenocarpa]|uniref:glucan endo-1,3-beta-D-glucosidase n=1 Tax=Sphenostylis stenocarpa TaxID=92480 RepID=A0AA86W0N7_9FABA|nr:unnamed protein product [Sphenostylis stenocarpa]